MTDLYDGLTPDDGPDEPAAREEQDRPRNLYPNVYEFVAEFIAPLYANDVRDQRTDFRWCSKWFHHTEAVARLEAVWKAFEVLRQDPGTGASVWFRDHADPCMAALTNPSGPFQQCSATKHHCPPTLPLDQPHAALLNPTEVPLPHSLGSS